MPFIQSVTLPANPSPLVKLSLEFAQGVITGDLELVASVIVENYHHVFLPGTALPSFSTRDQFIAHLKGILPVFGEITVSKHLLAQIPI